MAIILVIDDERPMRHLMARVLQRAGHTVEEAADGRTGLALFREHHPALVITDIIMPETEGIEIIRELRREDPGVPIIAVSGSNPIYLGFATRLGAAAGLRKPFSVDELLTTVSALLQSPRPDA
jgi:DNA-binding response OmpR family regulator